MRMTWMMFAWAMAASLAAIAWSVKAVRHESSAAVAVVLGLAAVAVWTSYFVHRGRDRRRVSK